MFALSKSSFGFRVAKLGTPSQTTFTPNMPRKRPDDQGRLEIRLYFSAKTDMHAFDVKGDALGGKLRPVFGGSADCPAR